jgi:hypothetical protein
MRADPIQGQALVSNVPPFSATFLDGLLRDDPGVARVRSTIANWYSREPTATRRDVRRRLLDRRSPYNSRAAFYELAVGAALRQFFGNAHRSIKLPQAPDWRVGNGRHAIFFEVATIDEPESRVVSQRRRMLRELAEVEGRCWVLPDWQAANGLEEERPTLVRSALRQLIRDLGRIEERTEAAMTVAGTAYPVTILPRRGRVASVIGLDETRDVTMNPGEDRMRNRIREKAHRYRALADAGHALVVVICTDYLLVDSDTLLRVVYGRHRIHFGAAPEPASLDGSGLLASNGDRARHTRLSEVWLAKRAFRDGHLGLTMTRAINPWARNRIQQPLADIAQFIVRDLGDTVVVRDPQTQQFLRLD